MNTLKNELIVVCCIAKHENDYITEWVNHYINLGFDYIYIFDNNEDNYPDLKSIPEIQKNLNKKVFIEKFKDTNQPQLKAYEFFYNTKNFDWVGYFDCDEFLFLKKHKDIHEYINDFNINTQLIFIPWCFYTDNNLLYKSDKPVLERFTEKSLKTAKYDKILCKCICKKGIKNIYFANPHNVYTKISSDPILYCYHGGNFNKVLNDVIQIPDYTYAVLNHYYTKSTEEFIQKVKRGLADHPEGTKRNINDYWEVNVKTPAKIKMLNEF